MSALHGIWGLPYVDLTKIVDPTPLDDVHEEVCLALARVETSYTGGTLKWMGVTAPPVECDGYVDAMFAIGRFGPSELATFTALGDDDESGRWHVREFGDETDRPFTRAQMLYLKYRYGVYFPWKVVYHLLENVRWEDKNSGAGKAFGDEALAFFPKTVEFVRRLPFREIGRCVLFGLEAHDHAPLHRDTAPGSKEEIDHSISICPRGDKTLFLASPDLRRRVPVKSRLYWFNDMDWHGVEPAPVFRYSIRVDGVFEPEFLEQLRRVTLR
jgi:Rieske 2Fe-2S family protein